MGLAGEIEARDGSRCLHIDDGSQQMYRSQPPSAQRVRAKRHCLRCRRRLAMSGHLLVVDS